MIGCDQLFGIVAAWGLSLLVILRQFGGHRAVDIGEACKLLKMQRVTISGG
jgi:hypothetical protein